MSKYWYYQEVGGVEPWKPCPADFRATLEADKHPAYFTALTVSQLADDISSEDRAKLKYSGPLYFDWDGTDMVAVAEQVHKLCFQLEQKGLDMDCARLYATGGRGFHLEVPMACFMAKPPKDGVQYLPVIYKQMAFEVAVDLLDFRVYSGGRGRMWRTCNVKRENGHYKVPITYAELQAMTPELYDQLTAEPRILPEPLPPKLSMELMVLFDKAQQEVSDKLKKRRKKPVDPAALRQRSLPSLDALLEGRGIKAGTGFHPIALQLAIVSETLGWSEETLVEKAKGLMESHESDSNRYNTPKKRAEELVRMHRYINDNPCYEFSIGGVKSLLNHDAPDLDGIPVTKEDVDEAINEAASSKAEEKTGEVTPDEFSDVASVVDLSKFGVYANTDDGKKRICALSFTNVHILKSPQSGQVSCYEADVLINGKFIGRQTLELDIFGGLQAFNKFAGRHSHALQGSDSHVRGLMMRIAEKGKKDGKTFFVLNREGLDMVNITHHDDPDLREPFMVWADNKGVVLEPRVANKGFEFSFQGYPDPRGVFRTDISDAPELVEWVAVAENKQTLREVLTNLTGCQQPNVIGKMLGWYVAAFYRMLFHKVYSKFPILHVNGAAGAGKCLARGTPVVMANGSVELVENLEVGDRLLGPYGEARTILSLASGTEMLYRVEQKKGDAYVVNASHDLSLLNTANKVVTLPDGRKVAPRERVKVNVEMFASSSRHVQRSLQGWRPGPLEFLQDQPSPHLDPYWLGAWIGDGRASGPTLCKPACRMTQWWVTHAQAKGHPVREGWSGTCQTWSISGPPGEANYFRAGLQYYGLLNNKHIPEAYRLGSVEVRRSLLAGLIDSDGNTNGPGFRWASASEELAKDVQFIARSLGLAASLRAATYWHKQLKRDHTTWEVHISGEGCQDIPCLDKTPSAPARNWKGGHGIQVTAQGVGEYFGFQLDGDHLFLLGDFTPTYNTEMNRTLMSFFFYQQEPKVLTPGSTLFAIQQHSAGSASIPLVIDEYKPHEMPPDLHGKMKLMLRDAYNCRDVTRGGGTRDNDDYRSLYNTQLSAPLVVIAEAAEEEAAVMERVVLCTVVRPPASIAMKWSTRFHLAERHKYVLAILGQYIASGIVLDYGVEQLTKEFDSLLAEAQDTFMLSEKDLKSGLSEEALRLKQGAKERTVFNYTVVKFGLRKLSQLVHDIFDNEFDETFKQLEDSVYDRMSDLLPSTQAEWIKVLNKLATMSVSVDGTSPVAIRPGREYVLKAYRGHPALVLSARAAYHRYRAYCKSISERPLFPGDHAFLSALRDSPALLYQGPSEDLEVPGGAFVLNMDELARMGVEGFKER